MLSTKLAELRRNRKSDEAGFTIIEVMIVLAIAGLILLIVLLAVPALQRNSRNTQIKNDAANVVGAVSTFASDNDGAIPTDITATDGTVTLKKNTIESTAKIQKGTEFTTGYATVKPGNPGQKAGTDGKVGAVEVGKLTIRKGATCYDESVTSRSISVYYLTEQSGGAVLSCVNS